MSNSATQSADIERICRFLSACTGSAGIVPDHDAIKAASSRVEYLVQQGLSLQSVAVAAIASSAAVTGTLSSSVNMSADSARSWEPMFTLACWGLVCSAGVASYLISSGEPSSEVEEERIPSSEVEARSAGSAVSECEDALRFEDEVRLSLDALLDQSNAIRAMLREMSESETRKCSSERSLSTDSPTADQCQTTTAAGVDITSSSMRSVLSAVLQANLIHDGDLSSVHTSDMSKLSTAFTTLIMYLRNMLENSSVPRYRKISTANSSFKTQLASNLLQYDVLLNGLGFVRVGNSFELSEEVLRRNRAVMEECVTLLQHLAQLCKSDGDGDAADDVQKALLSVVSAKAVGETL